MARKDKIFPKPSLESVETLTVTLHGLNLAETVDWFFKICFKWGNRHARTHWHFSNCSLFSLPVTDRWAFISSCPETRQASCYMRRFGSTDISVLSRLTDAGTQPCRCCCSGISLSDMRLSDSLTLRRLHHDLFCWHRYGHFWDWVSWWQVPTQRSNREHVHGLEPSEGELMSCLKQMSSSCPWASHSQTLWKQWVSQWCCYWLCCWRLMWAERALAPSCGKTLRGISWSAVIHQVVKHKSAYCCSFVLEWELEKTPEVKSKSWTSLIWWGVKCKDKIFIFYFVYLFFPQNKRNIVLFIYWL